MTNAKKKTAAGAQRSAPPPSKRPRTVWLRVVRDCPVCGESEPQASEGPCRACRVALRVMRRVVMQAWAVMHGGWRNG